MSQVMDQTLSPGGDIMAYRAALGRFATRICVAAIGGGERGPIAAITINSFVSVSLAPPILGWMLGDQSGYFARFAAADGFGISVLRADQAELARLFARTVRDIVPENLFDAEMPGGPVLRGALSGFGCAVRARERHGDHLAIYGETLAARMGPPGPALGFFGGQFRNWDWAEAVPPDIQRPEQDDK